MLAWIICIIVTLNYSYDFFIRVAPGVMADDLKSVFHINEFDIGMLSSAYFISYVAMQLPAGIILDRYNSRYVISIATLLCVLGNFLFSATQYYEVSFIGRILMGIGSAFGFIGAAKLASMWLPNRLFSSFVSIATTIGILGGLVTDTILSSLVNSMGWREGNNVFTIIGVVILILVIIFVKDNDKYLEIHRDDDKPTLMKVIKLIMSMFTDYRFLAAAVVGCILFIPINVLGTLWGVPFIQTKFAVSQHMAAQLNSILFIGTALGFTVIAIVSTLTIKYRNMLISSLVLQAIIAAVMVYAPINLNTFIALYFLLGFVSGTQALTFTIGKSLAPKDSAGSATAGINLINNLIPIFLLPIIGFVLVKYGVLIDNSKSIIAGSKIYTVGSYELALSTVIFLLIICIPVAMLLPKETK